MNTYEETRPWGGFRRFTHNEVSTVKILTIKSGQAFSLQYHNNRDEFWKVLSGHPSVRIGDETIVAEDGQEFFIPRTTLHRVTGATTDAQILEIAFGNFDESDIVRLEDNYGRT